jgi:sugar lactone lactonase YvrE
VVMFEAATYSTTGNVVNRTFGVSATPSFAASNFDTPVSAVVDINDRLWVSDSVNRRIPYFDNVSGLASGVASTGVIGSGATNAAGGLATPFTLPKGIAVSATGSLFVCNLGTVLRFDNPPSLSTAVTSTLNSSGASPLIGPTGVTVTLNNSLWVADTGSHRLLRFDTTSNTSTVLDPVAKGVVGQLNFSNAGSGLTQTNLNFPTSAPFVDSDGSLWVADKTNNRVLRFPVDAVLPVLTTPTLANGKPINSKTKIKSLARIIGTCVKADSPVTVEYTVSYTSGKPAVTTTSLPALATLSGPALATPTITNWEIRPVLAGQKGRPHTIKVTATDGNGNVSLVTTLVVKKA